MKKKCYLCSSTKGEMVLRRKITYYFLKIPYFVRKKYICKVCETKQLYYQALGK